MHWIYFFFFNLANDARMSDFLVIQKLIDENQILNLKLNFLILKQIKEPNKNALVLPINHNMFITDGGIID